MCKRLGFAILPWPLSFWDPSIHLQELWSRCATLVSPHATQLRIGLLFCNFRYVFFVLKVFQVVFCTFLASSPSVACLSPFTGQTRWHYNCVGQLKKPNTTTTKNPKCRSNSFGGAFTNRCFCLYVWSAEWKIHTYCISLVDKALVSAGPTCRCGCVNLCER